MTGQAGSFPRLQFSTALALAVPWVGPDAVANMSELTAIATQPFFADTTTRQLTPPLAAQSAIAVWSASALVLASADSPSTPLSGSALRDIQLATACGPTNVSDGPCVALELLFGTQARHPFPCCGTCPGGQPPSANKGLEIKRSTNAAAAFIFTLRAAMPAPGISSLTTDL